MRVFRTTYKDTKGRTREAAKWYVEFRDHLECVRRLPAFISKAASEELGRNLEKLVAYHRSSGGQQDPALTRWIEALPQAVRQKLVSISLLDGQRVAAGKPLAEHLQDWRRALADRNNSVKHVHISFNRVQALVGGCGFRSLADVQPSRIEAWLAQERRSGRLSIITSNYYLRDVKSFFRWLADDGRIPHSPLHALKPLNANVEGHRRRRCLPDADFQDFLAAAHGGKIIHRLSGLDRFMLYVTAGWTGLRAQELASLEPESLRLDGSEPVLVVRAAYSKHKREDVLPLRQDLADLLRPWLQGKPAGHRLWPGAWWNKAAEMVQADLSAAKSAWVESVKTLAEQQRRAESERFAYQDSDGRFFDFHSLRGQFVSTIQAAGVSLKSLQTLARHSRVETTLKHYARVQIADVRAALDALPALPGGDPEALRATGTEGAPASKKFLASRLALSGRFQGTLRDAGGLKTEMDKDAADPTNHRENAAFKGKGIEKAPPGFEPGMADLQSAARGPQSQRHQRSYGNSTGNLGPNLGPQSAN